jgi:hypothetical protein
MTLGFEPATFRLVAQRLNQATRMLVKMRFLCYYGETRALDRVAGVKR